MRHGDADSRDHEELFRQRTAASRQQTAKAKAKLCQLASAPRLPDGVGLDLWTLDTGSAIDAAGRREGATIHKIAMPHNIDTGKGEATVEDAVQTRIEEIDEEIEVVVVPEAARLRPGC